MQLRDIVLVYLLLKNDASNKTAQDHFSMVKGCSADKPNERNKLRICGLICRSTGRETQQNFSLLNEVSSFRGAHLLFS
jgi:hypothetical protein